MGIPHSTLVLLILLLTPVFASIHIPLALSQPHPLLSKIANLTELTEQLTHPPAFFTSTEPILHNNRLKLKAKPHSGLLGYTACERHGVGKKRGGFAGDAWWGKLRLGGLTVRTCVDIWSADWVVRERQEDEVGYKMEKSTNYTRISKHALPHTPACYKSTDTMTFGFHVSHERARKETLTVPFTHCIAPAHHLSSLSQPHAILGLAPRPISQAGTSLFGILPGEMGAITTFSLFTPEKAVLTLGRSPIPSRDQHIPRPKELDQPHTHLHKVLTASSPPGLPPTVTGSLRVGRTKHLIRYKLLTVDPTTPAILLPIQLARVFYAAYPGAHLISALNITDVAQKHAEAAEKAGVELYAVPCLNPGGVGMEIADVMWPIEGRGGKVDEKSGFCVGAVVGVKWLEDGRGILGAPAWITREVSWGLQGGGEQVAWVGVRDLRI